LDKIAFEIEQIVKVDGRRLKWWWAFGPPSPIVLVTSKSKNGKSNIITVGMYMPVSYEPPLVAISLKKGRYTQQLIKETGEFVINVPGKNLVDAARICGTLSGRKSDKFKEANLTPIPAKKVKPPLIKECIAHIECRVKADCMVGDSFLFIGEPLMGHVNKGTSNPQKAPTIVYKAEEYFYPSRISS
jgi:flavin reductase (DIM6/NTAB) family NADH-FMN oxidoreductase RutF